jgi:hypothetical protein
MMFSIVATQAGTLTLTNIFEKRGNIKVGDIMYHGITSCNTHALYYVNAYGGWDFLLMQGRSTETDSYTRHEHKREYDNRDVMNRGTKNYLNEIKKSFVLQTGWLIGNEASRIHHLLGSTEVYMFEIQTQRMIPVTITDNSCKYKTFQNEGGKLVEYEINVKVAKEMIRR